MKSNKQLVVFARAPRLGYGKTRLAKDIGPEAAYNFYRSCLSATLQECSNAPWQLVVAVASEEDSTHPLFETHNVITQINGGLGQRMINELSNNQAHHTIIIGSDIPELRKQHVQTAFEALDHHDLVFGPASDGGFWLVGCRQQFEFPQSFMQNVRWSTPHALGDTLRTISKSAKVAQVATLSDVDDATSFNSLPN